MDFKIINPDLKIEDEEAEEIIRKLKGRRLVGPGVSVTETTNDYYVPLHSSETVPIIFLND